MKNKAVTYFLIVIVALVWGVIIYRIFDATTAGDNFPVANSAPIMKIKDLQVYSEPKDTTHLMLNYRDPFMEEVKTEPKVIAVDKLISHKTGVKTASKPGVNWTFINYSGYIKNSKSKRLLAILIINGKEHTMMEGETFEKVKLVKNLRDSVKITYNGLQKYIVMTTR